MCNLDQDIKHMMSRQMLKWNYTASENHKQKNAV